MILRLPGGFVFIFALSFLAASQDTRFQPNGQQIPVPDCLMMVRGVGGRSKDM